MRRVIKASSLYINVWRDMIVEQLKAKDTLSARHSVVDRGIGTPNEKELN